MFSSEFRIRRTVPALMLALSLGGLTPAEAQRRADLSTFVAVGDSLVAGSQNIGLEASHQANGFAALIARQAGVPFVQPLIGFPGAPPLLHLFQNGPIPVIGPVSLQLAGRLNPAERPHNLAVPSSTVADALEYRPNAAIPITLGDRGPLVLGMPSPYMSPGPGVCTTNPMPECTGKTMIEQAKDWNPTTTLVWIGNNDALIAALFANLGFLTPVERFESGFTKLMDELESTGSTLIVATIPDVTQIPYFSPAAEIASRYAISLATLSAKTGIQPGDYVRRSALPLIDDILRDKISGPLQTICPPPIYLFPPMPCKLVAADAALVQERIKSFNKIIAKQAHTRRALLVDTHKLVDQIARKGYVIGNERLTTSFLGGLFSLDGVHPTNTGYAIVANYFIDHMNKHLGLRIPEVSVETVWAADPLRPFASTLPAGPGQSNRFED